MQHSLAQKLQSSHPHHHPASLPDLCLMHAKTNSSNYLLTQICHPPSQSKSPALVPGYSALKALLTRVPNESEHSSPPSRALGAMANQHLHLISTGAPKHILSFALAHQAHSTAY
eukprot:1144202-Pelagomonas_calceolata.AAC.1